MLSLSTIILERSTIVSLRLFSVKVYRWWKLRKWQYGSDNCCVWWSVVWQPVRQMLKIISYWMKYISVLEGRLISVDEAWYRRIFSNNTFFGWYLISYVTVMRQFVSFSKTAFLETSKVGRVIMLLFFFLDLLTGHCYFFFCFLLVAPIESVNSCFKVESFSGSKSTFTCVLTTLFVALNYKIQLVLMYLLKPIPSSL